MEHQFIICNRCGASLRVPQNVGLLNVTCPQCKNVFSYDSNMPQYVEQENEFYDVVSTKSRKTINLTKLLPGIVAFGVLVLIVFLIFSVKSKPSLDSRLIGTWESSDGWPKSITFNRDNTIGLEYTFGSLGREFKSQPIKRIEGNEIVLIDFSYPGDAAPTAWQSLVYQFVQDSENRSCLLVQVKSSPNDKEPSQALYYRVE